MTGLLPGVWSTSFNIKTLAFYLNMNYVLFASHNKKCCFYLYSIHVLSGRRELHIRSHTHKYIYIYIYRGADKSLARPGRKKATATEDFDFHTSYL